MVDDKTKMMEKEFMEAPARLSAFMRFYHAFFGRRIVIFGLLVLVIFVAVALVAPWISPYDPYEQDLHHAKITPNAEHWLGTDSLGRDTLSRMIYGSRTSLLIGVIAVAVSSAIGCTLGLIAGYLGGWTNTIIMRFIDAMMAFPMILLALLLAALLGGGLENIIIALGISMITPYARVMCGQALQVKENDYVTAANAIGASAWRVMFRHVAPNAFPPLIVLATMQIGGAILAEAGLSFLGVGIDPPGAAWGAMVSEGYRYLLTLPVLALTPGITIMAVVFAFNMVGDGLRDALDPRLRGML